MSTSMMLNRDLDGKEKEKVERLDGPISARFTEAGLPVRLCQGKDSGEERNLDFALDLVGQTVVASVPSDDFLEASDEDAVELVARAIRKPR